MSDKLEVNIDEFTSPAVALEIAKRGCPNMYTNLAKSYFETRTELYANSFVFFACISRARGLHEGCIKGIESNNPHATFPLIRAYAELVTIIFYSLKYPDYVSRLSGSGVEANKRAERFTTMFKAISDVAPGMADVYSELSEFSHFRQLGVYNAHRHSEENDYSINWTDSPRWKSEREMYIACAQLQEMARATEIGLKRFMDELIPSSPKSVHVEKNT